METIRFKLNGRAVAVKTDAERKLLCVLRTDLGVTGPKYGCG
jgi:nicotinate dehydrogenase subunit A